MEWQLPVQKVEIGSINIGNPWNSLKKNYSTDPLAPLSYFGTQFRLPCVALLFPPLQVSEYNSTSGRLVLNMFDVNLANIKMNILQETIINAVLYHQVAWFNASYTKEQIKEGFTPLIEGNSLVLKYKDSPIELTHGMRIRVAVKIHGISFTSADGGWSGKCHMHHSVTRIILQG